MMCVTPLAFRFPVALRVEYVGGRRHHVERQLVAAIFASVHPDPLDPRDDVRLRLPV